MRTLILLIIAFAAGYSFGRTDPSFSTIGHLNAGQWLQQTANQINATVTPIAQQARSAIPHP